MKQLRTALVVTLVAVLIWIFAEGESLKTETVGARITVDAPEDMALRIVEPEGFGDSATNPVTITLRGSTAGIDAIRDLLDEAIVLDAASGLPTAPGDHVINLAAALRDSRPFDNSGVSIDEVDPVSLRVRLVALQQITLPVTPSLDAEVDGAVLVVPETVTVRVPAELAATLGPDVAATAQVGPLALRNVAPGAQRTLAGIRVELPPEIRDKWGVRDLEPTSVAVTLTLRDTTSTAVIPRVPVDVRLASSELNRWHITIDDPWIQDVTIRGPSDLVDRVVASMGPQAGPEDRVTIRAVLALSFEELEQGIQSKRVEFLLQPPSAGTIQAEAPDMTVNLTVERAEDDQPETPPGA